MKAAAPWVSKNFDALSLGAGVLIGLAVAGLAREAASGTVGEGFYGVAAATFPVFLVALAVEQRFLNRLGMSEDAYVREAEATLSLWVKGRVAYEDSDPAHIEISRQLEARPKFEWVGPYAEEAYDGVPPEHQTYGPVDAAARQRFAAIRRGQAQWSSVLLVELIIGMASAISGLAAGGTSTDCGYYWLTTVAVTSVFSVIALTSFRDFVEDLAIS